MLFTVLLLVNINFGSAAQVAADFRCCTEPAWLSDVDGSVCVDSGGATMSKMSISCSGSNFTLDSEDSNYRVEVRDDRVVLKGDSFETDLIKGMFCLGNTTPSNVFWQRIVLCSDEERERTGVDAYTGGVLILVSIPFLLLTLAVYAVLPQLRDLQGKSVMCLCASFAIGLAFIAYESLHTYPDVKSCAAGGFMRYYFLLATFFWMNAITIQLFLAVRSGGGSSKHAMPYYSIYGWGVPSVLLAIVLHNSFNNVVPAHLIPGILGGCWFHSSLVQWLYFYGPLTLTVAANCVLFLLTAVTLWRHKFVATQRKAIRHKLTLSLRLFVVMGVSWLFEPISFAHGQYHIFWVIADIWNLLQGVLIFIVLVVLRKKAMVGLVSRRCTLCLTEPLRRCLGQAADEDDEGTVAYDTRAAPSEFTLLQKA